MNQHRQEPTAAQTLRDGGHAMGILSHGTSSDEGEEDEEDVQISTPRSTRAARRSTFRGAFHLTLLSFLAITVPGEATANECNDILEGAESEPESPWQNTDLAAKDYVTHSLFLELMLAAQRHPACS
jgi:hypothetical protein